MAAEALRPPGWYRPVAVVLLVWNLIGAYACIQQFRLGAEAMGPATTYDRALYASLPAWYDWIFALAEVAGISGVIALLARKRLAEPLLLVSLAAAVVQFGYLFIATDVVARKGGSTLVLPIAVVAICVFQVWLAGQARRRGWATR